jgi:hypothetical protein
MILAAAAAAFLSFVPATHEAKAQVSIGIGIGAEPVCAYGYYDYAPYRCAPYGYYGPEWFSGGRFIGAGRWYHGGPGFYGHVNHAYDPRYGYHYNYHPSPNDHWHDYGHNEFHGNGWTNGRGEHHEEHWHR